MEILSFAVRITFSSALWTHPTFKQSIACLAAALGFGAGLSAIRLLFPCADTLRFAGGFVFLGQTVAAHFLHDFVTGVLVFYGYHLLFLGIRKPATVGGLCSKRSKLYLFLWLSRYILLTMG